jgi:YegS/Rv2252/BmrU family lipid kinase
LTSPHGPLRLIVNPAAGRGAVRRTLPTLTEALRSHGVELDVIETTGPGEATEAARKALAEGLRFLVAVGGDGTVTEVVNGMFELTASGLEGGPPSCEPVAADAVLGAVAAGSGCDFVRTFGLDRDPRTVAEHLAGQGTMDIDVGIATYTDREGSPSRTLFANIAEVGYGGIVVDRASRLPRSLGRLRYLFAAYAAIRALDRQQATVSMDGKEKTAPLVNVVVANGQFFGGGMKVAPRGLPDDGLLNVEIFTGGRSQVFTLSPKMQRGEHLPSPSIAEYQTPWVALAPEKPMLVEADGDVLGTTPATFSLHPQGLRLKI